MTRLDWKDHAFAATLAALALGAGLLGWSAGADVLAHPPHRTRLACYGMGTFDPPGFKACWRRAP